MGRLKGGRNGRGEKKVCNKIARGAVCKIGGRRREKYDATAEKSVQGDRRRWICGGDIDCKEKNTCEEPSIEGKW